MGGAQTAAHPSPLAAAAEVSFAAAASWQSQLAIMLEFLDLSIWFHCLVLLWVTAPCIEMKAPGALESCDFGLSKITSVPR